MAKICRFINYCANLAFFTLQEMTDCIYKTPELAIYVKGKLI